MGLFDSKNFNGEVFAAYVDQAENLNRNELLKSRALVNKQEYAAMLPAQTGGNFITVPIKARIGGTAENYDGNTDITAQSRKTYTHGRIVVGRANGWVEKDFSSDITGEDFMPAAQEVAEYWDDVDQNTLLATLAGVFSMSGDGSEMFVNKHTYNITGNVNPYFDATTLNNGVQKALGDNKNKFALAIMHSQVATNLENLQLLNYFKGTDANGMQRDIALATINGRTVLIDDNMPVSSTVTTPETKGVYTITISTAGTEGDVIAVDGVEYTLGESTSYENKTIAIGTSASTQATALKTVLTSQYGGTFKVTTSSNTTVLTQVVGGTGAVPSVEVTQAETTGAMVATIATTTSGVAKVESTTYTTYVLGEGAIEYTNVGAEVDYEMDRNPAHNGGETTLYSRQRKIFSPLGISFKSNAGIISPTDAQLANGANWELANSNEESGREYFPERAIPIARVISLG